MRVFQLRMIFTDFLYMFILSKYLGNYFLSMWLFSKNSHFLPYWITLSQNLLDDCEPTKEGQKKSLQFVPAKHSYVLYYAKIGLKIQNLDKFYFIQKLRNVQNFQNLQGVWANFRTFLMYRHGFVYKATWTSKMSYEQEFCGLSEYVRF